MIERTARLIYVTSQALISDRVAHFLHERGDDVTTFLDEAAAGVYHCDDCSVPLTGEREISIAVYVGAHSGQYRIVASHRHHHRPSNVVVLNATMWAHLHGARGPIVRAAS